MNVIIHPPDRSAWDTRRSLLRDIIAARTAPPFLFDDVLIIVPSSRVKQRYSRTILDLAREVHGTDSIVPPDIQPFHRFLLHAGRSADRRLIDENSRLVLLEGIVKELVSAGGPYGNRAEFLAPSLSAAIADMLEELSFAGTDLRRLRDAVAAADAQERPPVQLLLAAFERYGTALERKGLLDPAGAAAALAEDPGLLQAASWSRVIIDGIYDVNALEAQVLRVLNASGSCLFLVEAPAPDLVRKAGEYHPLALTRDFLARLGLSPGDAVPARSPEDRFLAEALFSSAPSDEASRNAPPAGSKDLRLLSAVNMREEVTLIASDVKRSLRNGTPPDAVLVAFPSLDEYGPLVEEIFTEYRIPFNRALGRQLAVSPVSAAVISLLQAAQRGFSGASLLRVLSSPFLRFGDAPELAGALDRLMREQRITGGRDTLLRAASRSGSGPGGADILTGPLQDLFAALEPFLPGEEAPLNDWMARLSRLLAWSGIAERVNRIKGPRNVNLQAFRKLLETIASLAAAGRLFPEYRSGAAEWLFLLRKTLLRTRFQVPPAEENGVQVLGIEESAGLAWDEVYLGGLVDGAFPQRRQQNIFLSEAALGQLGIATMDRSRLHAAHHFYRLLLSAQRVTLTWPENQGEKPVIPSPFLAELEPVRKAGMLNRAAGVTEHLQHPFTLDQCRSIPELAKSLAVAGPADGLGSVLGSVLASGIEGMAGIAAALQAPAAASRALRMPRRAVFRVTELDAYLACPHDYYVRHVLGIAPLEDVTEDLSAMDRGSKVHAILREFYLAWSGPVNAGCREEAGRTLRAIAERSFSLEADTFRNRKEKELFLDRVAERFLDAEERVWSQGMRPVYLEQKVERFPLTLDDGSGVDLHATIDRIDADADGSFVIVDYKTGTYPGSKKGVQQDIFQLPLYAVMARALGATGDPAMRGALPLLKQPIGLAYYDLSGRTASHARDMVLYNSDALADQAASKPMTSRKSAAEFQQVLQLSVEQAKKAVTGILAGDFPATPRDRNRCRYCPNDIVCRGPED